MARRSRARGGQCWRECPGRPKGTVLQYFLWGWSGCSRGRKWFKRQKTNLLFTFLIWAISRASHICQVGRNHLPSCVYFLVYKYWFGLDPCLKQGVRVLLLVSFGAPNAGGPPGPHPSLHHISQFFYLQHLELPLTLLFEERIPLD